MMQALGAMSSNSPRTGLLLDGVFREHDTGAGHPECPDRYKAITAALEKADLVQQLEPIPQQLAEDGDVLLCHTRDYLETAKRDVASGRDDLFQAWNFMSQLSTSLPPVFCGGRKGWGETDD